MEFQEFLDTLTYKTKNINIELDDEKVKKFYTYMNLLLEWNEKINLTAITEPVSYTHLTLPTNNRV